MWPIDCGKYTGIPYIVVMKILFDPAKDAANLAKHGVSLRFGQEVLADPNRFDLVDQRMDYGEERYVAFGLVDDRVWVCVYTQLDDTTYRIISVGKANRRETRAYDSDD